MKASTLKIEQPLLKELYQLKPKSMTFSAFVKNSLEAFVNRQKAVEAARKYQDWLSKNKAESVWLESWENAPLSKELKKK